MLLLTKIGSKPAPGFDATLEISSLNHVAPASVETALITAIFVFGGSPSVETVSLRRSLNVTVIWPVVGDTTIEGGKLSLGVGSPPMITAGALLMLRGELQFLPPSVERVKKMSERSGPAPSGSAWKTM